MDDKEHYLFSRMSQRLCSSFHQLSPVEILSFSALKNNYHKEVHFVKSFEKDIWNK